MQHLHINVSAANEYRIPELQKKYSDSADEQHVIAEKCFTMIMLGSIWAVSK